MTKGTTTQSIPADRVNVFALTRRDKGGYAKAYKSPFVVKWSVAQAQRSKSFRTRHEAERWRAKLVLAVEDGGSFDSATGLPTAWSANTDPGAAVKPETFLTYSTTHVRAKWGRWKPKSRESAVEALVIACTALTDEKIPAGVLRPARSWLLHCVLTPEPRGATALESAAGAWLADHSLELAGIRPKQVEVALGVMGQRLDGSGPVVSTTLTRRRNALNHCLKLAERDGLVDRNPMSTVDRSSIPPTKAVDPSAIPDLRQAEALLNYIEYGGIDREGAEKRHQAARRRYAALLRLILLTGLRPSEASHLHLSHLKLPNAGWGEAKVWGGTVAPGAHWTGTGSRFHDGAQKWRDPDAPPRVVPIPPEAVSMLSQYIESEGPVDRLFINERGNPLTTENAGLRRAWKRARAALHPASLGKDGTPLPGRMQADPLFAVVPYDLRHTAASVMIAAGLPMAEIARRLGNSLDVLLRVYAGFFQSDAQRGNVSLDAYYAENLGRARSLP